MLGGEEGDVFNLADINMQLTWHEGVKPGALIHRERDMFLLDRKGKLKNKCCSIS